MMKQIDFPSNQETILDFSTSDDAGVYRLSPELAIVQTVDFITPVVNDSYIYGQIAAANSLSDIFAMGAEVKTVLNVVAHDNCHVTPAMLVEMMRGAADKVREAGGVVLGGHTVEDLEMKFGLSVTGIVHPDKLVRNNTIQPGDKIIQTKPIGMGVITTAIKAEMAEDSAVSKAIKYMTMLNKTAAEWAVKFGVHAMTDVTGFGLLGHMYEMTNSQASIRLDAQKVQIIPEALEYASMGLFPSGSWKNREHYEQFIKAAADLDDDRYMLMFDAQTSGGLLISLAAEKADLLIEKLHEIGMDWCEIIAEVVADDERKIEII
jgi:selenide,water dikinase